MLCQLIYPGTSLSFRCIKQLNLYLTVTPFYFRLCESFKPEEPIYSEDNHLIIHFHSDYIIKMDGFLASYEVIKKCKWSYL